jgi:hypothetical protein
MNGRWSGNFGASGVIYWNVYHLNKDDTPNIDPVPHDVRQKGI